jgi:hypothetical protein
MAKKLKPRTTVTVEELRHALEQCEHKIPQDAFNQFCNRVYSSAQIFLEIDEPKLIAKELREINQIARKPDYTLLNVIGNASRGTIALIEDLKPLPPMPSASDANGISIYAKEIRERIVISGHKLSDRVQNHLIGPSIIGRPKKARIDVLVSFIAAAYVSASDKGFRREWDADGDLPFHHVLEVVFKTLRLDANVDEAIRRHKASQK